MNKRKLLIILGLLALSAGLFAKNETYTYDFWEDPEMSPDAYRVSHVLSADDLKLDVPLKNPQSIFAHNNHIFVADTDNSRIIELEYTEKKTLVPVRIIDQVKESPLLLNNKLNRPYDVYVDKKENLYIADTDNGCANHGPFLSLRSESVCGQTWSCHSLRMWKPPSTSI